MERINFKEVRGLGEIIQDAAKFIRQNFVKIIKLSLLWVFVPLIIGSVLVSFLMKGAINDMMGNIDTYNPFAMMGKMIPGYIIMGFAMTFLAIIVLSYMRRYTEGSPDMVMGDVVNEIKQNFLKVFLGSIVILITVYLGFILCLIPGIYLGVVLAPIFSIMVIEGVGFPTAWKRCFALIKGQWWNTFGLYLVTLLINMAITSVVIIPMYAVMFARMFTGLKDNPNDPSTIMESMGAMSWFMPIAYLISFVTFFIFMTVISFKYYSLVELKEGVGEKEAIDEIGK